MAPGSTCKRRRGVAFLKSKCDAGCADRRLGPTLSAPLVHVGVSPSMSSASAPGQRVAQNVIFALRPECSHKTIFLHYPIRAHALGDCGRSRRPLL